MQCTVTRGVSQILKTLLCFCRAFKHGTITRAHKGLAHSHGAHHELGEDDRDAAPDVNLVVFEAVGVDKDLH